MHQLVIFFFFFKQKTAYEISACLVGSEMCIRDRIGTVRLGHNASVWWNVTIRGDNDWIELGDNVNIQDGSVVHTDEGVPVVLERNVSVGHLVMLHGCTVRENSLIGIGAIILNRAVIGKN